jgi:hypothetical protein
MGPPALRRNNRGPEAPDTGHAAGLSGRLVRSKHRKTTMRSRNSDAARHGAPDLKS